MAVAELLPLLLKDFKSCDDIATKNAPDAGAFFVEKPFLLSDKHFQTVVKTCAFESKSFMQDIIANKTETHPDDITYHFIDVNKLF